MSFKKIKIVFCLSLIFLGSFFVFKDVLAQEIKAPIILNAYQIINEDEVKITINGLTENLTSCQVSVSIYLNNLYYNTANISIINNEFCSFSLESDWIKKEKSFEVTAIMRNNKTLTLSPASSIKVISVKKFIQEKEVPQKDEQNAPNQNKGLNKNFVQPMIAPTLFTPFGKIIDPERPVVSGLAKNDSIIKIYIDNELENQFWVNNNPSGTASFLYSLKTPLKRGSHLVYAIAQDKDGKESKKSNNLYFNQYTPTITATTSDKNLETENKSFSPLLSVERLNTSSKTEIKGISETKKTVIADKKEKNGSFVVKLIIFIIFLSVIILWMILVGKELKKEKKQ